MDALTSINSAQNAFQRHTHKLQQGQGAQQPPPAGSLIIHDSFEPSRSMLTPWGVETFQTPVNRNSAHGEVVRHSAQFDGFAGQVVEKQVQGDPLMQQSQAAQGRLYTEQLDKPQALRSIRTAIGADASSLYSEQARMLEESTAQGTRNSAANISLGVSKASTTERLYGDLMGRLNSQNKEIADEAQTALGNYSKAFEFDSKRFMSEDPKVNGPERQKLVQGLINETHGVISNSKGVAQTRQRFDKAVSDFEANNNSVVIAAGNEEEVQKNLSRSVHGLSLRVPKDFSRNILENEKVTSVGATRWTNRNDQLQEHLAPYSSQSEGVDIYASGSVGFQDPNRKEVWGTSFAAPRVAASMAELHKQNPDMSSEQVESLMKSRLTHNLSTNQGELTVLDYQKSFAFLRQSRY